MTRSKNADALPINITTLNQDCLQLTDPRHTMYHEEQTSHSKTIYTNSPPDPYLVEEEGYRRKTYTCSHSYTYLVEEDNHLRTTYNHSPPGSYLVEKESQSRMTYTRSPSYSHLVEERSYLFWHTNFYIFKNKQD